jgi:hypothetical protein
MKLHLDEGEHLMGRLSELMLTIKDSPFNSQAICLYPLTLFFSVPSEDSSEP